MDTTKAEDTIALMSQAIRNHFRFLFMPPDYTEDEEGNIYSPSHRKAMEYAALEKEYYRQLRCQYPNAPTIHRLIVRHVWFGEPLDLRGILETSPDSEEVCTSNAEVWTETQSSGIP